MTFLLRTCLLGALFGAMGLGWIYSFLCMVLILMNHGLTSVTAMLFVACIVFLAGASGVWLGAATGGAWALAKQGRAFQAVVVCWVASIAYLSLPFALTKSAFPQGRWEFEVLIDFSAAWIWIGILMIWSVLLIMRAFQKSPAR